MSDVNGYADGPFLDDLTVGETLPTAPHVTVDGATAALYQAICGDNLPLTLSAPLCAAVTGSNRRLVSPGLVLQLAVGQSTVATRRVIANLFYRDVQLHRPIWLGETLSTRVTVTAIGLASTGDRGKALLRIETRDDDDGLIATMCRCALLPARSRDAVTTGGEIGHPTPSALSQFASLAPTHWQLTSFDEPAGANWQLGECRVDPMRDRVTSAVEFARLTQNQAMVHRDPALGQAGRPLVYGGHTVALAQASLTRLTPELVTMLGWQSCDHTAPVFEGDALRFEIRCTDSLSLGNGRIVEHEITAYAQRAGGLGDEITVLRWRPVSWLAR
jgi:2-methylfumaryl-CoA hydratase